jgi:hypothetical protein
MLRTIITAAMLMLAAQPAMAESEIAIRSAVFVEQEESGAARTIERASVLSRGQRVVTVLNWQAPASRSAFTVTTRLPSALSFERSSSGSEEISTDGGRSWGKLGQLRLHDAYGWRLASPQDITHLRWRLSGRERAGRITYSAFVR